MTTLMIDAGPTAPDALVTRTGGVPLVPAGTEWPRCASCDGPLQFLAQVLLKDVEGAGADRGVLALFACQNDPGMCDDWDPTSGGNRALLVPLDGLVPLALPELPEGSDEDVLVLDAVRAVERVRMEEPDYDEAREAWAAGDEHPESSVLGQLGGEPAWVQGDETPSCTSCARRMSLVAQLEEGPDQMNFGGGGCAYAFACAPCGNASFVWQC